MSNQMLYDPLLVRYLALELDQRLRGRACAAAPLFVAERGALLPLEGGQALRLDLHPTRGWIHLVPWEAEADELDGLCLGVTAPPDERRLEIRLQATERFRVARRKLVVELHTNQWNALLVSEEGNRILSVLRARTAGERSLHAGAEYEPPAGAPRYGAESVEREEARRHWEREVGLAEPERRRAAVLRGFAYTGTPNVRAILGDAIEGGAEAPWQAAFERWWELRQMPPARPVLIRDGPRALPYPVPLPGARAEPVPSLLEGMGRLAAAEPEPPAEHERALLQEAVQRRRAAAARKVERLEEELAAAEGSERFRSWGDLLLAHFHRVPRGASEARLESWEGEPITIPLDPALSPADNAARWYDEAGRRERAGERLPGMLEEARAELERWDRLLAAGTEEALPDWAIRELERRPPPERGGGERADSRPYRSYRTSGGLEVRVGRSAKENDRLTFGNSSPNDIWLHARSVPGSHVVLRWTDTEGAPPARDLEEAAVLAACYSKARTSAVVPVDWTRRKYVRKPRGAAPGGVVLQRAKTLFVEPDTALEERLREE